MRNVYLPFAAPDVGEAEITAISEVLQSGWITTGPVARKFERDFAAAVGARNAVAVSSGTAALHLGLEAVGLRRGELVLTTPYAFAATAEVVRYFDAVPVFVDVDPHTLNVDTGQLAAAVEDLSSGDPDCRRRWLPPSLRGAPTEDAELRAILPVHVGGLSADLDAVYGVASERGLAVVEDAAHAFPAQWKGSSIGSNYPGLQGSKVTQVKCFSFYATKSITTGEGGMLTTDDEQLADRCRIMALHGISRDAWKRYASEGSWYYEIAAPGFKYNMGDISAALGLTQLAKAERMRERRREIATRFNEAFGPCPELQTPCDRADCRHAWHLYMLRLNLSRLVLDRAQFIEELRARKIGASVHFIPLHAHPYYRETYGYRPDDFPVAHREYLREVSLPIYSRMSDGDVEDVVEAVLDVARRHRRVA